MLSRYYFSALFFVQDRFDAVKARKDRGATAVEYGLMVALIAIVILVAVQLLGNNLKGLFNDVAGQVKSSPGAAAPTGG